VVAQPTPDTIDVARIERELLALLHAPENLSPDGQQAARTHVVNLVAVATAEAHRERILATLDRLSDHHPSRAIIATVDPTRPAGRPEARVQVHCRPLGTTGMRICVEQIVLESSAGGARQLPSIVLGLLLADLPVVVWWPGEPALRDPLLYDLLEPAYRLIADSAEFIHLERSLTALSTLRRRPGLAIDLVDLTWQRLTPWRDLIAQFWDDRRGSTSLRQIERIEIDLCRPPGGRSQRCEALLIVGWLVSRLDWRPTGFTRLPDGYEMRAKRRGGDVTFRLRISAGARAGINAIRIQTRGRRGASVFSLQAQEASVGEIRVALAGQSEIVRQTRLESLNEAELLASAIDTLRGEIVFEDALEEVAAFLALSSGR